MPLARTLTGVGQTDKLQVYIILFTDALLAHTSVLQLAAYYCELILKLNYLTHYSINSQS